MAEPDAFDPTQLDAIEDALEGLEELEDLESLGLDAASTERLGAYREILVQSREAFPMESPGDAGMASLMAAARQSVAESTATAATNSGAKPAPSWARWLPFIALAGATAAVLLVIRPPASAPGLQTVAEADAGDAQADAAKAKEEVAASEVVDKSDRDGSKVASGSPSGTSEDTPLEAKTPAASAEGPPLPTEASSGARKAKQKATTKKKSSGAVETEPAVESVTDKEIAWDQLMRAHSLRRKGQCSSARSLYAGLLDAALPANVRAQAEAGTGLCREYEGKESSGAANFSRAREILRDIDGWIAAEREEMRALGTVPKRAKKSSAERMPSPVDAFDN